MNVKNIKNIDSGLNSKILSNNKSDNKFSDLLKDYLDKTTLETSSKPKHKDIVIEKNNSFEAYNDLKINHLNPKKKNSILVETILAQGEIDREEKINLAKERIKSGFYLKDDIINQTSGKILDSLGF